MSAREGQRGVGCRVRGGGRAGSAVTAPPGRALAFRSLCDETFAVMLGGQAPAAL